MRAAEINRLYGQAGSARTGACCRSAAAFIPRLQSQTHPQAPARSGLTLLEIVLALAIFCGAMAVLAKLAWNGNRATVQARLKTQATIRCAAKLNEVLAGAEPMQSTANVPFPDNNQWTWSQVVNQSSYPELVQIQLTVSHRGKSQLGSVDVTLKRWARLQSFFAKAATQNKEEADAKANLEPGNTSSTGSSSSSSK